MKLSVAWRIKADRVNSEFECIDHIIMAFCLLLKA